MPRLPARGVLFAPEGSPLEKMLTTYEQELMRSFDDLDAIDSFDMQRASKVDESLDKIEKIQEMIVDHMNQRGKHEQEHANHTAKVCMRGVSLDTPECVNVSVVSMVNRTSQSIKVGFLHSAKTVVRCLTMSCQDKVDMSEVGWLCRFCHKITVDNPAELDLQHLIYVPMAIIAPEKSISAYCMSSALDLVHVGSDAPIVTIQPVLAGRTAAYDVSSFIVDQNSSLWTCFYVYCRHVQSRKDENVFYMHDAVAPCGDRKVITKKDTFKSLGLKPGQVIFITSKEHWDSTVQMEQKERERIAEQRADELIQAEERERDKRAAKAQKKKSKLKCTVHDGMLSDLEHMLSLKKTEMAELETKICDLAEIFAQQTRELQLETDAKKQELQSREIAIMKKLKVLTRQEHEVAAREASLKKKREEMKEMHNYLVKVDHDFKNQKAAEASLKERDDAVRVAEACLALEPDAQDRECVETTTQTEESDAGAHEQRENTEDAVTFYQTCSKIYHAFQSSVVVMDLLRGLLCSVEVFRVDLDRINLDIKNGELDMLSARVQTMHSTIEVLNRHVPDSVQAWSSAMNILYTGFTQAQNF
jgi:hypothetical protein